MEPSYVKTNLTGNMKIPLLIPDAESFVRSAVSTIGLQAETTGHLMFEIQVGRQKKNCACDRLKLTLIIMSSMSLAVISSIKFAGVSLSVRQQDRFR